MARRRRETKPPQEAQNYELTDPDEGDLTNQYEGLPTPTTPINNESTGERKMAEGLTQAQIDEILNSSGRSSNYGKHFAEFMESGKAGVDVRAEWPEYQGEKPATASIKASFEKARDKAKADKVLVRKNGDNVYLINTDLLAVSE